MQVPPERTILFAAGEELDVRLGEPLTEIEAGMAGTLEVFHAGAWGSVCDDAIRRFQSEAIDTSGVPVWPPCA